MNEQPENKSCNTCDETKAIELFMENRNLCKDCHNLNRRTRIKEDEEFHKKINEQKSFGQRKKTLERQEQRRQAQIKIGEDNQQCRYCEIVQLKTNFRHNRQKCIDCEQKDGIEYRRNERDCEDTENIKEEETPKKVSQCINKWTQKKLQTDPIFKFMHAQRARIYSALQQRKTNHTIEYLGCTAEQFFLWMSYQFNDTFTFENHGKIWHIDHVLPISRFNLENTDEQYLCLNWRNTMPLSTKENLSKGNRIIQSQIQQHYQTLLLYHKENKIELPQKYIDLYAQHDQIAGNPLEL